MDSESGVACNKENIYTVSIISCFHVFGTDAMNFPNIYF